MDAALSPTSMTAARVGPGNIRSLILEKEKELHDINEYRIRTLEALLRDKETAMSAARQKLSKLQEDFKYNLKLLEGRDEELALYDANFASLKNVLRDREIELSENRAREAELQVELQRAKEQSGEVEVEYQQKLKDARAQAEGAKWKFDDAMRGQQDAMEAQRRNWEKLLRAKEDEMESQRRELTVTFDDMMRQRETEFQRANDELQTKVREFETTNKALKRDADVQGAKVEELKMKNENLQQMMEENAKEIKSLEWTVAEVKVAKETQVRELENKVAKLTEVKQELLDEYERKMAELLQSLHSVEKAFVQQKTQYEEELERHMARKKSEMHEASARSEAKLETLAVRLRESEETVEALQAELKHIKWDADDKVMDKEREVERVRSTLQDFEKEQHRVAKEMQQRLRSSDRETQSLQERLEESARQLALLKDKDKAQRQELLESVEKQEDLQRELVTVNMRWENRWQQQQLDWDEQLKLRLRELQQTKDRLLSEKQATEERLIHAENEVQRLRSDLLSSKAEAHITDSFDSQNPAKSTEATRMSVGPAPVAPSPLWSDDPGTLSPVPDMSPLLTDSPSLGRKPATKTNVDALEMENVKLRELIRQMKESLTQQAEEMEALPSQASGSRSASKFAAQLLEAQERCVALEAQLHGEKNSSGIALELESCKRELAETRRSVEMKSKQIVELESHIQELEKVEPQVQSERAALEAQVTDLHRKLKAANDDIDRLVQERSQLMELSNQLRADLRRSGSDAGSRSSALRVDFAGKKDYDKLVAELTQSLEEMRIHNKTLKKELRRMVKVQVQSRESPIVDESNTAATIARDRLSDYSTQNAPMKRRSSTLSMMKSLDPGSKRNSARSSATSIRSALEVADRTSAASKSDLDEQLRTLARSRRPSDGGQLTKTRRTTRSIPPTIAENVVDDNASEEADEEVEAEREEEAAAAASSTQNAKTSVLERLFQTSDRQDSTGTDDSNATVGGTSSSKVTDARLKLQQAREMLMLSGKRAPVARASVATPAASAGSTRPSDRETTGQRSAAKKLKHLQSKRAEMINERKKVRNYNLVSE